MALSLLLGLVLFYWELGLACTKLFHFVEYASVNCFNNSDQPAVNARRQGDKTANASVVAETMKELANS